MVPLRSVCTAVVALLLATASNAHFTLTTPATIGFVDDTEGNGPCGGVTPNFASNTITDFHVGGSPVGMKLGHAQAHWLFRGTLDQTGNANWTQLFPIVLQNSIGQFCEVAIPAPASWVGHRGLLGVVAKAEDGLLFQCAAVNFVAGAGSTAGVDCRNASTEAVFETDSDLAALADMDGWTASVPAATTTGTGGSNATGATTSSTPSSTKNAAPGFASPEMASLNNLMIVLAMGAMGAAYVL